MCEEMWVGARWREGLRGCIRGDRLEPRGEGPAAVQRGLDRSGKTGDQEKIY